MNAKSGSNRIDAVRKALLAALLLVPIAAAADVVALPDGDVFKPLLADPKEVRFTVGVLGARSGARDTTVAAVAYGENFGLARWPGTDAADGWQLGVSGALFAQFDLDAPSADLVNGDFTVGVPVTWRRGDFSARARLYHQSSHLGDEFLLRKRPARVNLSYEALELLVAWARGGFRLYGGGETLFHRQPAELEPGIWHAGAEYRQPRPAFGVANVGAAHFVAGVDVKGFEQHDWEAAVSVKAGFEFRRGGDVPRQGKQWRLLAEYYDGQSPYGQFFTEKVTYAGISIVFAY